MLSCRATPAVCRGCMRHTIYAAPGRNAYTIRANGVALVRTTHHSKIYFLEYLKLFGCDSNVSLRSLKIGVGRTPGNAASTSETSVIVVVSSRRKIEILWRMYIDSYLHNHCDWPDLELLIRP